MTLATHLRARIQRHASESRPGAGAALRAKIAARLSLPVDASNATIFAAFDAQSAASEPRRLDDFYSRLFPGSQP